MSRETVKHVAAPPLVALRVIDLTDALGAYAGRLLADLGADVVRVESRVDDAVRLPPYHYPAEGPPVSMFERFVNAGKRSVQFDLDSVEGRQLLDRLLAGADIVIESSCAVLERCGWSSAQLAADHPRLVRVVITPYGLDAAAAGQAPDDLVLLATGGLLHLGGYQDAGPVAPYGYQSTYMASIYATVAALAGVIARESTDRGAVADVSAQECVAQALETSAVGFALTGKVAQSRGESALEAGTGIYPCADGYVSVVAGRLGTAAAWDALVSWMSEAAPAIAQQLADERWRSFEFRRRPEAVERFAGIFTQFAASHTRRELYVEAQRRGIALSPLNDFGALADDAQLVARGFFHDVEDPAVGGVLRYPAPPYRLSASPVLPPRRAPRRGADTHRVLSGDLGLTDEDIDALVGRGIV